MQQYETYIRLAVFLLVFIFFALSTGKIMEGLSRSFASMFDLRKLLRIDRELLLKVNRNYALAFLILLVAFLLSFHTRIFAKTLALDPLLLFLIICCAFAVYLLYRGGLLALLDAIRGTKTFLTVNRFFRNYLIISLLLTAVGDLVYFFVPSLSPELLIHWIIISCAVPYVVYLYMASSHIFKNNFSLLLYILYICALEILPATAALKFALGAGN